MGRSAFFGSRAVHMVSASMSKVNRTGKPLGESGMTDLRDERLEGHGARARTLALEAGGEGQHTTVGGPGAGELHAAGGGRGPAPAGRRTRARRSAVRWGARRMRSRTAARAPGGPRG